MSLENSSKLAFTSRRMAQQWQRMQGVKMLRAGIPAHVVAEQFSVSARVVFKWVAAFSEGGQNALLAKEGAGPGSIDHVRRRSRDAKRLPRRYHLGS
ncbi:MAG: helix-turn-helix domain-containing protein [Betaproteobacteria bacterium]|nr:helix-turn-helix domain-containing protein [Betaproteobacteria bacterium]